MIERYLNKECSADEANSIEERIAKDTAFAEEVDWFKQFRSDMQERTSFRVLAEIEQMKLEDHQRARKKIQWLVGILVSAVIVLIIVLNPFQSPEAIEPIAQEKSSEVFDQRLPEWEQYLPYPAGLQNLGEEEDKNLKEALQLIEANQYAEALAPLHLYLEALPFDDNDFEMQLEYGKILLREEYDTAQAREVFKDIRKSDALPAFKEAATFYLGLSHLLSGESDSARLIWQSISGRPDHPFYTQVQEILNAQVSE